MSFLKLAIQVGFWYLAGTFVPRLLAPFVGESNANHIFLGFVVTYIVVVWILSKNIAKQGHKNSKILPPSKDIPKSLHKFVEELGAKGFVQLGVIDHNPLGGLLGRQTVYTFANQSRNIFAYASTNNKAHVTFSCSFPDGFDVSTNYPMGLPSESDKIIRRVVKSSMQAALDFHIHHVKKHMETHGKPKQFASIRELLDWEDQHKLLEDGFKTASKTSGRLWLRVIGAFFLAPIIGLLLIVPVYIYLIFQGYSEPPAAVNVMTGILPIVTTILGLVWAYKPLYRPETVEDRKKKN